MEWVTPNWFRRVMTSARTHHAAIAIAVAAVAAAISLLRPLDIAVWTFQSKMFSHEPSGQIVYVSDERDGRRGDAILGNERLARVLDKLSSEGAKQIVLAAPVERSGSDMADLALRDAIARLGDRITLTHSVREDFGADMALPPNDPFFTDGVGIASRDIRDDFMRFVWVVESEYVGGGLSYPTMWTALADSSRQAPVFIDYSIDWKAVPQMTARSIEQSDSDMEISGKSIVIGNFAGSANQAKVSRIRNCPPPLIHFRCRNQHPCFRLSCFGNDGRSVLWRGFAYRTPLCVR